MAYTARIAAVGLGLAMTASASAWAGSSPKKGVGTWSFAGESQAFTNVDATWFYTWSTTPSGNTLPAAATFVPMIWGSASVTAANFTKVKTEGSVLLGFNEPDNAGQSNLTPAQALALWPQLVATGMRLGSPAVAANAQKAGGWLDTFMSGATSMGLRVDFICLHWYGGDFNPTSAVTELQSYISQTHAKYNLPIWVTEFALTNFGSTVTYPTEAEQAAFAAGAVDMLEATTYVERYAWFALPPCDTGTGSSSCTAGNTRPLSLADGTLTSVGVAYAGAGPDGGTAAVDGGGSDGATAGGSSSGGSGGGDATPGPAGGGGDASASDDAATSQPPPDALSGTPAADGAAASGDGSAQTSEPSSSGGCHCETARHGSGGTGRGAALVVAAFAASALRRRSRRSR